MALQQCLKHHTTAYLRIQIRLAQIKAKKQNKLDRFNNKIKTAPYFLLEQELGGQPSAHRRPLRVCLQGLPAQAHLPCQGRGTLQLSLWSHLPP
jgi:hypothetical protein